MFNSVRTILAAVKIELRPQLTDVDAAEITAGVENQNGAGNFSSRLLVS